MKLPAAFYCVWSLSLSEKKFFAGFSSSLSLSPVLGE
jgi:hypothetical protein